MFLGASVLLATGESRMIRQIPLAKLARHDAILHMMNEHRSGDATLFCSSEGPRDIVLDCRVSKRLADQPPVRRPYVSDKHQ